MANSDVASHWRGSASMNHIRGICQRRGLVGTFAPLSIPCGNVAPLTRADSMLAPSDERGEHRRTCLHLSARRGIFTHSGDLCQICATAQQMLAKYHRKRHVAPDLTPICARLIFSQPVQTPRGLARSAAEPCRQELKVKVEEETKTGERCRMTGRV